MAETRRVQDQSLLHEDCISMQTLTVKCKLLLSEEQRGVLEAAMRAFAAACNGAAVSRNLNIA